MEDWRIKDYTVRCYNLQNKITPLEVNIKSIEKQTEQIMRKKKCDKLTALKILKKQLESKIVK